MLVYAVGDEHPLRASCRRILRAHGDSRIQAATTVEVIQEFTHVRTRRRSRSDAVVLARHYAVALPFLIARPEDLEFGLRLFERYDALGAFDAVLAAVALNQGADALVSADRAFGDIPGLRWVHPLSSALDALIAES